MTQIKSPKKLIEVALPLDDINAAAAREKSIRHGHPSTLHLWWARRPLAAARAVIFAQMVNDPSETVQGDRRTKVFKQQVEREREKLFDIIRELVLWENTNNEQVLNRARDAIWQSWRETCALNSKHPQAAELFNPDKLPAFHDPFAGGGALPLEAQRLGLESYASDLNPVAVMINKAMIEIPPKFAGRAPVGPIPDGEQQPDMLTDWSGARGLAEDVRRYGHWMREQAFERIGHLYPKVEITAEMVAERPDLKPYEGEQLTVIAWLWARTVKSPNPAFSHVEVPLVSTFTLSKKKTNKFYLDVIRDLDGYRFKVKEGDTPEHLKNGTKQARGANFKCLVSDSPIEPSYIKSEGVSGRIGSRLLAVVLEGKKGRIYLDPDLKNVQDTLTPDLKPSWRPSSAIPDDKRSMFTPLYGLTTFADLYTDRQTVMIDCLASLVEDVASKVENDCLKSMEANRASDYGVAISVYISFFISRMINLNNALCQWRNDPAKEHVGHLFSRQAIPMVWDYAEANPFSNSAGSFDKTYSFIPKVIASLTGCTSGFATQANAANQNISENKVISTDPPYYDNIGYSDLSDFFYVWLRRSCRKNFPNLFGTLTTPKADELVANPYRHGSKEKAELFFMDGMTKAIHNLAEQSHPAFPVSIYYAFKQSETKEGSTTSTGWVTFLEAVIQAGFSIDGTWPMRTELANRMISSGTNALASSIVLVCRKRPESAESISRRQFQRELREEMPEALAAMIGGESGQVAPIAPVDLAQSAIGPGMAIFSKYAEVLNQDGSRMGVHDALILINRAITEHLNPDSGNFDADTLFCDDWFSQYGWSEGQFGEADTLARAKGTSVDGVRDSGVIESGSGKVRLLKWSEYPHDWDPRNDTRTPVWEACHQMIRVLNQQGESAAGALLARMPEQGELIRQLAYHLYTLCERKKWAEEARAYNELIGSWHAIVASSHDIGHRDEQIGMEF